MYLLNRPLQARAPWLVAITCSAALAAAPAASAAIPADWAKPTTTSVSGESLIPVGPVATGGWGIERDLTAMGGAALALYGNGSVMVKTTTGVSRVAIAVKGNACAKPGEDGNAPGGALGLPHFFVQARSPSGAGVTQSATVPSADAWTTLSWKLGSASLPAQNPGSSPNTIRIWFDNNYTDTKVPCSRNVKIDQIATDSVLIFD